VLVGIPLACAVNLDACAVDQQVQQTLRPANGDVDLQGFMAMAQSAEVRHCLGLYDQPQEAFDKPCRLAQRQAEQHLDGQQVRMVASL
jgi:hypothetical protein